MEDEGQGPGRSGPEHAEPRPINLPAALLAVIAILFACGLGSYTLIKIVEMLAK